jgi:ferrous iron transport protein B
LMDRLLAKVGLSGKSFIPLLSSFACAIPGIMATRTIENRRDRLATIFIAPFMSCSARLPVYALLIGAFFAPYGALTKGGILLACYGLGIVAAVLTAWMFKRSFRKGPAQAFILELPTYKLPQASQVARVVWSNTSKFLTKAGTVIFCLSVILWAMSYYPRLPEERAETIRKANAPAAQVMGLLQSMAQRTGPNGLMNLRIENLDMTLIREQAEPAAGGMKMGKSPMDSMKITVNSQTVPPEEITKKSEELIAKAVAAAQSEYSISGRIGHFIEPVIRPLGFNWKMGVGLVSAFAAREVFVSSLGIVYSVGEVEGDTGGLEEAMKSDRRPDGSPVWTPLVAVSLLVWFVLAMQCMSTLAIVRRETGGWGWPVVMLVYMNVLAYFACLGVYQFGRLAGWA